MKLIIALTLLSFTAALPAATASDPNIIVIFCDDLGYGDLGCYGSTKNRTPRVDQLANDGMMFTDFYSSSPVCTPSRASLMTGCYPRRVGMHEDFTGHWVLIPRSRRGLNPKELTVAEVLKSKGYVTACVGKWHLGDQPPHLPTQHGFDYYFGIPYSNDMQSAGRGDPPLPLVKQSRVIEAPADQTTLTKRYTEQVISFIEDNQAKPFFVYLPHTFPHLPLFASPEFSGKSANGRYGDSIEEIDWSTGQILDCLDRLKLAENTLVIFTSDNGAIPNDPLDDTDKYPGWQEEMPRLGSNLPFRGKKSQLYEGGIRTPSVISWQSHLPKGKMLHPIHMTDWMPTLTQLVGYRPGSDPQWDGQNIWPLLTGEVPVPEERSIFWNFRGSSFGLRNGDWKLIYEEGQSAEETELFHIDRDPYETRNLAGENLGRVEEMIGEIGEQRKLDGTSKRSDVP